MKAHQNKIYKLTLAAFGVLFFFLFEEPQNLGPTTYEIYSSQSVIYDEIEEHLDSLENSTLENNNFTPTDIPTDEADDSCEGSDDEKKNQYFYPSNTNNICRRDDKQHKHLIFYLLSKIHKIKIHGNRILIDLTNLTRINHFNINTSHTNIRTLLPTQLYNLVQRKTIPISSKKPPSTTLTR